MDLLEVGKIVNTHGLRGEVKVVPWTDYPEVFEDIDFVYVKKKSEYERLDVKGIKYQKNNLIVRFSQITDINMAENLLLPVIDDVVLNIDVEGGKITVRMMDGLEDLA